ncbi:twin-arginine translocase TatA/TatE family subunit [Streptomyces chryseus]|uniref:Sec-independent protein translocase protein TatA n=1 Tax=Streptomyces chryseus TaxID=68186 RepID=A0ABQ3E8P3_9ACTN|nr:twin-arginine translocase TatA/TatE family subunit [Streptomyces chryseus]GHB30260.1 Sec-independent protein translocase protein TatA [Streptomyces chryseus]
MFGLSELAILLIVVIVFIGAKKLPDLARNAGKAARILKSESKAMKAEGSAGHQPDPHIIQVRPGDRTAARPDNGTGTGNGPVRT